MAFFNEYLKLEGISRVKEYFLEEGTIVEVKKNDFFMKEGQFAKKIGFIDSGSFRYLAYQSQGQEKIVGYTFEKDFATNYPAFLKQSESIISIQAIQDSVLFVLTFDEFINFLENHDTENIRAQVAETFLFDIYKRMLSLYCDSPEERYLKLLNRYPQIIYKVNLKEIASFINVTPETLSRIRKKISLTL